MSLVPPLQEPSVYSSYHLYPILIKGNLVKKTQIQIFNELRKKNIGVNLHYIPVHRHPFYKNLGFKKGDFPITEKLHKEIISIPIFPTLKKDHQKYIIDSLRKIIT